MVYLKLGLAVAEFNLLAGLVEVVDRLWDQITRYLIREVRVAVIAVFAADHSSSLGEPFHMVQDMIPLYHSVLCQVVVVAVETDSLVVNRIMMSCYRLITITCLCEINKHFKPP